MHRGDGVLVRDIARRAGICAPRVMRGAAMVVMFDELSATGIGRLREEDEIKYLDADPAPLT